EEDAGCDPRGAGAKEETESEAEEMSAKEQKAAFAKAREIALALPGVTERISWGEPNWLVGGKMFAAVGPGHGGPHLAFKAAGGAVEGADDRFKTMSSVSSWRGTEDWYFYFFDFGRKDDWKQLKHLIEVSWELH